MSADQFDMTDYSDLEALSVLVNYRHWVIDAFTPYLGGHVVEYGAGIGSNGEKLLRHVDRLSLVEPMDRLFLKLAERFLGAPNVHLEHALLEDSVRRTRSDMFDGVVMINVLEHVADDQLALREFYRILRPNGHICIFVPALQFLFSDYDQLVGHYRRYDLTELTKSVSAAGFKIRRANYFDLIGIAPWFITMRLLRRKRINSGMADIYDKCVVPFGRFLESIVPPPIGKNIILVACKL